MDAINERKSLATLFAGLGIEVLWLASTLALPIWLPLPLAAAIWLLLFPLQWWQDRYRGRVGLRTTQLATGWTIGLGFALCLAVDGLPGYLLGLFSILAGLYGLSLFERYAGLRLTRARPAAEPLPPEVMPSRGRSAWNGPAPETTPQGEPVRVLGASEIAMGGPQLCDYLLPDGAIISNASPSATFSEDGRYFVSPVPSRDRWGLLLYDRQEQRLYRCRDEQRFWELDRVDDRVYGRHSPLTSNAPASESLETLKNGAEAVPMVSIADIRVAQDELDGFDPERAEVQLPAPPQAPRVTSQPWLPHSLRELPDPLQPLRSPAGELHLDGQPSGLLLNGQDAPLWRADGLAFACAARERSSQTPGYWLWQADAGWRRLGEPPRPLADEVHTGGCELLALDADQLVFSTSLGHPSLSEGRYGALHSFSFAPLAVVAATDAQGLERWIEIPLATLQPLLALDAGHGACAAFRSAELYDGSHLHWQRQRMATDGRYAAYRCRIGDWTLPGEWLLDHRLDEQGERIALVAFADSPALAQRLAVVDVRARRLHYCDEALPGLHLQGFREGRIHLLCLRGRSLVHEHRPGRAAPPGRLQGCDFPLQAEEVALGLTERAEETRPYYQQVTLEWLDGRWQARPSTRIATVTQHAQAASDYLLPAPAGGDSAYLFGFTTRYRREAAHAPHGGGWLLTASGCGIGDLAPPAIWSADGRYLALCRYLPRGAETDLKHDAWRLLLLDCQARTLRRFSESLGQQPLFESFEHDLQFSSLRDEDGDAQGPRRRSVYRLEHLLQAPAQPLGAAGKQRWLPAEQQCWAHYWARQSVPVLAVAQP
ncbi:ferredoxin [Phytopseudomonas dryadis]|uniref:Ferredoxin n=1 Tax=Phytopseudomonas dryadis TaxID=2487520 RepID=A0ABY1Z6Q7_9GAMM|nr:MULTISPECIES: ferredoxin [Pseudomonas]TBV04385.1 ferredoxin [Pseudomonas dryadis]TBV17111.1 ferredoxin [Pseudomonas sp. FRB 230]